MVKYLLNNDDLQNNELFYKGSKWVNLDEHANRLIVVTSNMDVIDILAGCVMRNIPVVTPKNDTSILLLGEDYPLFNNDTAPFQIASYITDSDVEAAHIHISNREWITQKEFIKYIARSKIGYNIRKVTA